MQNETYTENGGKIPYFESSTKKKEQRENGIKKIKEGGKSPRITPEIRKPTMESLPTWRATQRKEEEEL